MMLKKKPAVATNGERDVSLWLRNIQLGIFATPLAAIAMMVCARAHAPQGSWLTMPTRMPHSCRRVCADRPDHPVTCARRASLADAGRRFRLAVWDAAGTRRGRAPVPTCCG